LLTFPKYYLEVVTQCRTRNSKLYPCLFRSQAPHHLHNNILLIEQQLHHFFPLFFGILLIILDDSRLAPLRIDDSQCTANIVVAASNTSLSLQNNPIRKNKMHLID
jgi:hypothetical protein